jgi:hypothetical protein
MRSIKQNDTTMRARGGIASPYQREVPFEIANIAHCARD